MFKKKNKTNDSSHPTYSFNRVERPIVLTERSDTTREEAIRGLAKGKAQSEARMKARSEARTKGQT